MKQHITVEQSNELSERDAFKLKEWWTPRQEDAVFEEGGYVHVHSWLENWEWAQEQGDPHPSIEGWFPQLSIGQMIEFLHEHTLTYDGYPYTFESVLWSVSRATWIVRLRSERSGMILDYRDPTEPCDALWEAVKAMVEWV